MAGGLNRKFMGYRTRIKGWQDTGHVQTFIRNHWILVPGNVEGGSGQFGLRENGKYGCTLEKFASTSKNAHPINAYYLKPFPGQNNHAQLPDNVDFMFTDALNGCQFLAYGPSRNDLTMEHNNYADGGASYAARFANADQPANSMFFALRAGDQHTDDDLTANHVVLTYELSREREAGATVVGVRDLTRGWRFYVRRSGGTNTGPTGGPF